MSTPESNEPPVVELAVEPRRHRARVGIAVAVAVLLVGGVLALALWPEGEPSPTAVLAEVREFVDDSRTATFEVLSESSTEPDAGDVGHSSTSRSRATGRLRLPDAAYAQIEDGDWVTELISIGNDQYTREAGDTHELQDTQWVKWSVPEAGDDGATDGAAPPGAALEHMVVDTATSVLSSLSAGTVTELDVLLDRLKDPERLDGNRIRATATVADLVPDEMQRTVEEMQAQFETETAADDESVDLDPQFPSFDARVTATIEYGPEGRLDVLELQLVDDTDDERSTHRDVIRFADWGKPVSIEPPSADRIDETPHVDEEKLAKVQQRYPVFAATAPPDGWKLLSLYVEDRDEESETCESVSVEYGREDDQDAASEEDPPAIEVVTVEPGCTWLNDNLPDMSTARQVRVGTFTARLIADAEDNYFTFLSEGLTAVLDIRGTTVVAASNLPEAQFLQVLRTLAPIDLARQPIAAAPV